MLPTGTMDTKIHLELVPVTNPVNKTLCLTQSCHRDFLIPIDRRAFKLQCNKEGGRIFSHLAGRMQSIEQLITALNDNKKAFRSQSSPSPCGAGNSRLFHESRKLGQVRLG